MEISPRYGTTKHNFPLFWIWRMLLLRNQNGNKDERKSVYFFVSFELFFSLFKFLSYGALASDHRHKRPNSETDNKVLFVYLVRR